MSIKTVIESGVVVNTIDNGDKLEDIGLYIAQNICEWEKMPVLWDVENFRFETLDPEKIRTFIRKKALLSQKRSGLKTAILVENDLGYGMMRMFQVIAETNIKIKFGVFRTKDEAFEWINEE